MILALISPVEANVPNEPSSMVDSFNQMDAETFIHYIVIVYVMLVSSKVVYYLSCDADAVFTFNVRLFRFVSSQVIQQHYLMFNVNMKVYAGLHNFLTQGCLLSRQRKHLQSMTRIRMLIYTSCLWFCLFDVYSDFIVGSDKTRVIIFVFMHRFQGDLQEEDIHCFDQQQSVLSHAYSIITSHIWSSLKKIIETLMTWTSNREL